MIDQRFFDPNPAQQAIACELYTQIEHLPLICPHGHVDPRLFADENTSFGTPADLFIIPDHYVFRMLYSQGIPLESLGVPRKDGCPVETDHRKIWQTFADHFYLFRGTPTCIWLTHELSSVFGVTERLSAKTAQVIYDKLSEKLSHPEFRPRALFAQFGIDVLCTTDAATDTLEHHQTIRRSDWSGNIRPTFRPDQVINLVSPSWQDDIRVLSQLCGVEVSSYTHLVEALENRREFFKQMGAVATDHAVVAPDTTPLSISEAEDIFQRALRSQATTIDAQRFIGHMLVEMARMSIEDGLVMQVHPGSLRDHNSHIYRWFGPDKGADIPVSGEFTRSLLPLLNRFGNDRRLTLILFTLDEATYARELAPIAGHYPAVRLGPPWWFHDSLNGMRRYFDQVVETAGLYNTAGFNDDARSFPSIPARHDLWRRASVNWLAGLVIRQIIDLDEAIDMASDLAYGLARRTYRLEHAC